MAFGVTGICDTGQGRAEFEAPIDQLKQTIESRPDGSIVLIRIYAHGAPGSIDNWGAADLGALLKPKMAPGGQVHLLGCSTAGVDAHPWNPIGGLGLLARMVMYAPLDDGSEYLDWTRNLALDLSTRLTNVYVLGLGGISFPLSRITEIGQAVGVNVEGYRPTGLMADRQVYYNGKRRKLPTGGAQW